MNSKLFAGTFFGIWFQSFGLPQHVWAALIVNLNPAALRQSGTNWNAIILSDGKSALPQKQRVRGYPNTQKALGGQFNHSEVMRSTPTGTCNPSAPRPAMHCSIGEKRKAHLGVTCIPRLTRRHTVSDL